MVRPAKPAGPSSRPGEAPAAPSAPVPAGKAVEIPNSLSVKQLADILRVSPVDVIKQDTERDFYLCACSDFRKPPLAQNEPEEQRNLR